MTVPSSLQLIRQFGLYVFAPLLIVSVVLRVGSWDISFLNVTAMVLLLIVILGQLLVFGAGSIISGSLAYESIRDKNKELILMTGGMTLALVTGAIVSGMNFFHLVNSIIVPLNLGRYL